MLQYRLRLAVLLVALASAIVSAPRASACSVGIPTPEQMSATADQALKDFDLIAEATVLAPADFSERKQKCTRLLAEGMRRCDSGEQSAYCRELIPNLLDLCEIDGAAQVMLTRILKGQSSTPTTVMYDTEGICGSGTILTPGSGGLLCGTYDAFGGLQVIWCDSREVEAFERYYENWNALKDAVKRAPADLDAGIKLAEFLETWNDRLGAVAAYGEICTSTPNIATGCAGAGRILFEQKRFEEAEPYLQKAFDREPADRNNAALLQRAKSLVQ